MTDTFLLLRIGAASALIGFLVFCLAHVVVVWRKRNANKNGSGPVRSGGRRLAWGCLIAGVVLLSLAAVQRELTRGEGSLTGEGLYILRAQDDLNVEWLRDGGVTEAGQPLARFSAGTQAVATSELQARLARAESEREVLDLLPLSPDPELTRRYQMATQERNQAQLELGQAVIAVEAAERDLTSQLFNRKESLVRLELTLTARRKELDRVTLKSTYAKQQLTQYQSVSGSASLNELREISRASQDADIELAALTQEVKDLQAEKKELRSHLDKLETGRTDPSTPLRKQVATLTARVARLESDEADLKAKIEQDSARSNKLRSAEKVQADAKVREQQAAVDSLSRDREVVAPFRGTIAYRSPSPNATKSRGTLAVLAPNEAFLLTARLNESDAEAIRNGAEVMIDMGEDSTERRHPATFHKTSSLTYEPGFATVQLACQPPPEMVRKLAEGEKLTAAFTWHPSFYVLWPFRTGLLLFVVGLILMGWLSFKRSKDIAETTIRDRSSGLAKVLVGRLLGVRNVTADEELSVNLVSIEVMYPESTVEVHQTASPRSSANLISRLRQLFGLKRSRKSSSDPDKLGQLRHVLVASGNAPLSSALKKMPPTQI